MVIPKRIIKLYTPTSSALDTPDEQSKAIQDLYDQVIEFYNFLSSPEFRKELIGPQGEQGNPGANGQNGQDGQDAPTPYQEAVEAGYDKSIETFYGIIEGDLWIGPGAVYSDVYENDDYHYEDVSVNNPLNIECNGDYIFVIYPKTSEFNFNLTMGGFPIVMNPIDTTTLQNFNILRTAEAYNDDFNITI